MQCSRHRTPAAAPPVDRPVRPTAAPACGSRTTTSPRPYRISLGSILPEREQCSNLIVPVCVSCSHIAFGSIRMEPVFMILGQSAGTVASMAIEGKKNIHDLTYDEIRKKLVGDGQILEF